MKLVWSARAKRDLFQIANYIAVDNPDAALRWIDRLRDRARRAAAIPRAGRVVPEGRSDDVREVLLQPYRIIYRVEPKQIVVLTVVEGHRLIAGGLDG